MTNKEEVESIRPNVVLAVEYFFDAEKKIVSDLLNNDSLIAMVLRDEAAIDNLQVRPHIAGLWTNGTTIHNDDRMEVIKDITRGKYFTPHTQLYTRNKSDITVYDYRDYPLYMDLAPSFGLADSLDIVDMMLAKHESVRTRVVLPDVLGKAALERVVNSFSTTNRTESGNIIRSVDFILTGMVRPEHPLDENYSRFRVGNAEYVRILSEIADDVGAAGLFVVGKEAKHAREGQYVLAGAMTFDGIDYVTVKDLSTLRRARAELKTLAHQAVLEIPKRATSPGELQGRENTDRLLGHALHEPIPVDERAGMPLLRTEEQVYSLVHEMRRNIVRMALAN